MADDPARADSACDRHRCGPSRVCGKHARTRPRLLFERRIYRPVLWPSGDRDYFLALLLRALDLEHQALGILERNRRACDPIRGLSRRDFSSWNWCGAAWPTRRRASGRTLSLLARLGRDCTTGAAHDDPTDA